MVYLYIEQLDNLVENTKPKPLTTLSYNSIRKKAHGVFAQAMDICPILRTVMG